MTGKQKQPTGPNLADQLGQNQQVADEGGLEAAESFANIEPDEGGGGASFANINPVDE